MWHTRFLKFYILLAASWKHPAILCLIHHYKENMHVMNSNSKRHEEIWQDISDALAKKGYHFSHLQCEDKWKYLKKLYVETVDKNKESGTAENTCPYFKEFHEIYGKSHSVNPPALASNRTLTNMSVVPEISSDLEQEYISKKKRRNSKQLESWTDTFRNDAAAREEARQKRHEESLALQKEHMQTQNTLLAKILEKLS